MAQRRIWVKRPNASATLIRVNEGDLVDDLRETVLAKYANTLGTSCDAPDIALLLRLPNGPDSVGGERALSPDEDICHVLDACYPDGQTMEHALIITIPTDGESHASPMSGHVKSPQAGGVQGSRQLLSTPPEIQHNRLKPATGQAASAELQRIHGKRMASSPLPSLPFKTNRNGPGTAGQSPPPRSTNVVQPAVDTGIARSKRHEPFPPSEPSLRPSSNARNSSHATERPVPPINVLIVEDNPISLRLLEQRMKRLGVRYQTAMNGQIAVEKWKASAYHLVLMDIQMPVMNGIQATTEIRKLERMHGIGNIMTPPPEDEGPLHARGTNDTLSLTNRFKSPVIIVALTASSLESDRHAALNAGCNDFLTKPVNNEWMERKVREWASMQALVDVDGWRRWTQAAT